MKRRRSPSRSKAPLAGAAVALVVLLGPGAGHALAAAQYDLDSADVQLQLADDASLLVTEKMTFDFSTKGKGAYRDIPETLPGTGKTALITDIEVSDDDEGTYRPGGNTALGSDDAAGVMGVEDMGDTTRIVWHYRADPGPRVFTVRYRAVGATVAYDDIVDVNWKVWGDQWDRSLGSLTASLELPPGTSPQDQLVRVYGHSKDDRVEGATEIGSDSLTLEASDIPAETWVELRGTVPRAAFSSVSGARVEQGNGLEKVVSEEQAFATRTKLRKIGSLVLGIVPAVLISGLLILALFRRREREVAGVPEHLSAPPYDDIPLVAQILANEGIEDVGRAHLATLFDLVRRKYYKTEAKKNSDDDLDLELSVPPDRPAAEGLSPYEKKVLDFFDKLLDGPRVASATSPSGCPSTPRPGAAAGRRSRPTPSRSRTSS